MITELPPHSVEIEEAIIGSILQSTDALLQIIDTLSPQAFFVPLHREIYQVAVDLHKSHKTPDLYSILAPFKTENEREKLEQIAHICSKAVFPTNVDTYASVVTEKWNRRRLIELGQKAIAVAYDPTIEWEAITNQVETELTDIVTGTSQQKGAVPLSDLLIKIYEDLCNPDNETVVPTHIPQLDEVLSGGLRPSEMVVIAGRPGMGKSQVLNAIALDVAESAKQSTNLPVLIFSMEMSGFAQARRMLAARSEVSLTRIISKRLSNEDNDKLFGDRGMVALMDAPIFIDDTSGMNLTISHIISECNKLKRQYGGVGLLMVDYLQLFGDRGSEQRAGEVGKYSAALASVAKMFECPVVSLAQLSRGVESRSDKRPQLSDLGESGKIEQDAHAVIMLYREDYYEKDKGSAPEEEVILEWIVTKNRNGPCRTIKTFFHTPTGRIRGERPSY